MSINCANKYAIMDANTAIAVEPNTVSNRSSPIGDQDVAGTMEAVKTISNENKEAKIPAITTWLAFFFP